MTNNNNIITLAIDTSCDDTAIAILKNDCVLSNIISSQEDIHNKWGGVYPSLAKRAHQENFEPALELALQRARLSWQDIDTIAITYGPGLALCLEVGVQMAKDLAHKHQKPLVAVNHMEGHVLSPLLRNSQGNYYNNLEKIQFPILALTVSGGHTELVWMEKIGHYKILGRTLDDAAGEAFDKIARMLDLGYPGGPNVEKMAEQGDKDQIDFPVPMIQRQDLSFSYSGIKTSCLYKVQALKEQSPEEFANWIPHICASAQHAIVRSLTLKLRKASKLYRPKMVFVGGGVSANNYLRHQCRQTFRKFSVPVIFPDKKFCMDNAAMIGLVGYHKAKNNEFVANIDELDRRPSLSIEHADEFVRSA